MRRRITGPGQTIYRARKDVDEETKPPGASYSKVFIYDERTVYFDDGTPSGKQWRKFGPFPCSIRMATEAERKIALAELRAGGRLPPKGLE